MNNINSKSIVFPRLDFLRRWLESIEIKHPAMAHLICRLIPANCPFARDIAIFDRTLIISIPPLCKLNPLYEQMVGLRFKSLCYLVDECGEDITFYC